MVLVPAGEFVMGSAAEEIDQLLRNFPDLKREWFEREIPKHRVYLDAFYLDKYEVTNARFQQFVQATGYRTTAEQAGWGLVWNESKKQGEKINGASWKAPHGSGSTIQDLEMHPVVQVNWDDAQAYCEWAGKRLPTEAEWEKAARGTEGWTYPWGHQFDGRKLNFCDRNCETDWKDRGVNDGYRYTAPVGRFEGGKSPYGAYDMAGNVWEWVADWYDEDYYRNSPARNPQGPESGQYRVLRGGAWIGGQYDVRVSFRLRLIPETRFAYLGVRCAKTP
jgi:serine/threonine-protein kinase